MSYTPIRIEVLSHSTELTEPLSSESRNQNPFKSNRANGKRNSRQTGRNGRYESFSIIVHSHLCWDWVWQRPQQFLSRLSRGHKILFVETIGPDPELALPVARYRKAPGFNNITLLRLQFPSWQWHELGLVDIERRRIVNQLRRTLFAGQFDQPVQWFYDPMAVTAFRSYMNEIATVYDCMDELSKFRFAPPEIHEREAELLAHADVVFAGGRKLWEAKSAFHDNCHFYGCGVEGEHFGKARLASTTVPREVARLPRPVLGYFGVIDERIDYDLLAALADQNPGWSIVMVGPVLKVEENALPRRANLHWLGQRQYIELPALCKGFDICLMPFAMNEATEFINPTKTLEYMAAARPIVSTPVPDVVSNFGQVVNIARSTREFISLCRQCIDHPDPDSIQRGLELAQQNSWDSIVGNLEQHIQAAIRRNKRNPVAA